MGSAKRVTYFLSGLLMMLCSVLVISSPEAGYQIVLLILELMLLIRGVRQLVFYFSMARFMVGGISIFYRGLLLLDAGLFALNLDNVPRMYTMLYLIGYMLIAGLVDAAYANEERRQRYGRWKYQMFSGTVKIVISFICLFHLGSVEIITAIYGVGLFFSAVSHMVTSFRRSAIVYVQ